jgi:hypothetical protein
LNKAWVLILFVYAAHRLQSSKHVMGFLHCQFSVALFIERTGSVLGFLHFSMITGILHFLIIPFFFILLILLTDQKHVKYLHN